MNFNRFKESFKRIVSGAMAVTVVASCSMVSFAAVDGDSPLPDSLAKTVVTKSNTASSAKNVTIKTLAAANSLISKGAHRGIDVSKWQGKIDWAKVSQDEKNIKFAFIRSNYGAETDPYFATNVSGAQANGIRAGAYHYARFKTSTDVKTEAQSFLNQLGTVSLDYPVVLDVENHYNLSKKELSQLCNQFMEIIEAKGYTVILYTFNNFYKGKLDAASLNNNHVWIANYLEHPGDITHTVWQHTSYGTISGISGRVDINVAYQDLTTNHSGTAARATTLAAITPSASVSNGSESSEGTASKTTQDGDSTITSGAKVVSTTNSTAKTPAEVEKKPAAPVAPISASGDVKVSPTVHKAVVESMNKKFEAELKADTIDMVAMNTLLMKGIQREIKNNFNEAVAETGTLTDSDINEIIKLTGTQISETDIIRYVQKKLVYLGYYTDEPTGRFDTKTSEALKAFQSKNGIEANGVLNRTTIKRLFGVA